MNPTDKPRPPLTRQKVIEQAVALIDEHGVDQLTMRKLGAALGVEAMSLYHHVMSKEDLLGAVADHVMGQVAMPSAEADWAGQIRELAAGFREVGMAHPDAFRLLTTQPRRSIESWTPLFAAWRSLDRAGLGEEDMVDAFHALCGLVVGYVLMEVGASHRKASGGEGLSSKEVPPDNPELAGFVEAMDGASLKVIFDRALDLLLDGIAAKIEPAGADG